MILRLVRMEIVKITRRPRTYLGYVGILLLVAAFVVGFKLHDPSRFVQHRVGPDFTVVGTFFNGPFVAHTMMFPMFEVYLLPLFVALVAGDLVSGEAAEGTLRALLVRPVGRLPVIASKLIVAILHTVFLILFLGVTSLGLGILVLGKGDLFTYDQGIFVIPMREAMVRMAAAYAGGLLSAVAVAALALFLSTLVDNSNGAIIGTLMVLIMFGVIKQIPFFEPAYPYLLTSHTHVWRCFFADPIPWDEVRTDVLWLLGYSAAFVAAAALIFRRKDILS